jgi:hypothetical protein
MNYHSTYFEHLIYRNTEPNRLRWAARINGSFAAADTLAGIKEMIRDYWYNQHKLKNLRSGSV